ncbi:hypothetical protein PPYR_09969 [Photinus pyralis]|uniref:Uncharacterized protein n=2 Tax=Photinus pyralis TaxID=7054 RepID=A0A1Y1LV67_PHOPY|nr:hypothetical protein PPYR_09969 [Photinus pyralis]
MPRKQGGSKEKGGLRLLWIPTGSRHKHKSNKYYLRDNYDSPKRSMMSGDSPNYLDFKEGRSTPPPTTSKEVLAQDAHSGECKSDILAASVILEPLKNKEMCYIDVDNEPRASKKDDDIITPDNNALKSDLKENCGKAELNGLLDQTDASVVPSTNSEKKECDEENNNSCVVNCLYYSLQCCECNIM